MTTVIRTFRIGRIARLVNGAESLNQLFNTLLLTLPGLVNIGMLLLLLFFIFSCMAVQLFAKTGFNGNYNSDAHFRNFGTAFVTMLRFSTGENWNGYMHDLAAGPDEPSSTSASDYAPQTCGYASMDINNPQCNPAFEGVEGVWLDVNGHPPPKALTFGFFIFYQLCLAYVFLNLFIGIILEGFDTADETKRSIKPEDFEKFSEHWELYDPDATFYVEIDVLKEFVQTLYEPWGFGDYVATDQEVKAKIAELDLKVTKENKVHFKDVLMGLSKEAVKTEFLMQKMAEHKIEAAVIHRVAAPLFHKLSRVQAIEGENFRIGHHYAAEVIQACCKRWYERKMKAKAKAKKEEEEAGRKRKKPNYAEQPKALAQEEEDEDDDGKKRVSFRDANSVIESKSAIAITPPQSEFEGTNNVCGVSPKVEGEGLAERT